MLSGWNAIGLRPRGVRVGCLALATVLMSVWAPRTAIAQHDSLVAEAAIRHVTQPGDDVTVIPFTLDGLPNISEPLFPAEIDGHRGLFGLDVGSSDGFVNRLYLKPNATGGLDTVTAGDPPPTRGAVISTTMRLGTLQWPIRTLVLTSKLAADSLYLLGNIGIRELTPFETIIDYTHQRLVLIRLDSAGHRLAPASDYTPVDSLPLLSVDDGHVAVVGRIGDVVDTLSLDTGSPIPVILTPATRQRVRAHLDGGILDSLVVGQRTFTKLLTAPAMSYMPNIIGYPVLSQFGAVGFNQRTHQLLLYR